MIKRMYTSESVTEGHPDKVCDQISDAILDAILAADPMARVACETTATTGMIHIMGEITTTANIDYTKVARETINKIGYDNTNYGFDGNTCAVLLSLDKQSPDIAMGVDGVDTGAGDQGMMFGYACSESEQLIPATLYYAHALSRELSRLRKEGILPYLRPDGKSQVSIEYAEDGTPLRCSAVVVSTQHDPGVDIETLRRDILEKLILPTIPAELLDTDTKFYINPTGRFVLGGPVADSGLTGRKIIVDTYGGFSHHGGGAFSGKDPTKVDRSASYMARYAAKNIVASGAAKRCEIGVAYAIGVAHPVSIYVDTFGTGVVDDDRIAEAVSKVFDFRPAAIIDTLGLRRPIYAKTAAYGHFGRDDLPWEQTDRVDALRAALNL